VSHPPVPELVEDLRSVGGWLSDEDVALFLAVDDATRAVGLGGDVLEIGVYKGKSAVVLGYCIEGDERLVVVDPFGRAATDATVLAEQQRYYDDLSRAEFDRNYARFHARPPVVLERFSTDLEPADIGRDLRLVHVDGAHDYASVAHDVDLVLAVLADDGVLVFDDAIDRGAPGVVAAVWEAIGDGRLLPLMTTGKVWTCRPAAHPRLMAAIERQLSASSTLVSDPIVIRGVTVLQVGPRSLAGPPSKARRAAHLMTPPAAYVARDRLRSLSRERFGPGARGKTEP
jgi:Methyltransferase domain